MSWFPSFVPEARLEFVYYISVIPASSNLSQSQCYIFSQQSLAKTIADLNLTQREVRSRSAQGTLGTFLLVFAGFGKLFILPYLHVYTPLKVKKRYPKRRHVWKEMNFFQSPSFLVSMLVFGGLHHFWSFLIDNSTARRPGNQTHTPLLQRCGGRAEDPKRWKDEVYQVLNWIFLCRHSCADRCWTYTFSFFIPEIQGPTITEKIVICQFQYFPWNPTIDGIQSHPKANHRRKREKNPPKKWDWNGPTFNWQQFFTDFNHQEYVPSIFQRSFQHTELEHTPSNLPFPKGLKFGISMDFFHSWRCRGITWGVRYRGVARIFLGLKYQLNVGLSIPFVPWMRAAWW